MAKILVNYPTRSRPHKFMSILRDYATKVSGNHQIEIFIKVDEDDLSLNNARMKRYATVTKWHPSVSVTWQVLSDCKGKIDAINRDIDKHDFDFVVCIADDINVLEQNWDQKLVDEFNGDYNQCLNYKCDKRLEDFRKLIIMPILGKPLYDHFGYVYHPSYLSEWCDDEMAQVLEAMGKVKHVDCNTLFVHDWEGNQDDLMRRNMQIGFSVDRVNFENRKKNGFVGG